MASGTDFPAHLPSDSQLLGLSILILSCIFYELLFHDFGRYRMFLFIKLLSFILLTLTPLLFSHLFSALYIFSRLFYWLWPGIIMAFNIIDGFGFYVSSFIWPSMYLSSRRSMGDLPLLSIFCFCVVGCSMDMALYLCFTFYSSIYPRGLFPHTFSHLAAFAFAWSVRQI